MKTLSNFMGNIKARFKLQGFRHRLAIVLLCLALFPVIIVSTLEDTSIQVISIFVIFLAVFIVLVNNSIATWLLSPLTSFVISVTKLGRDNLSERVAVVSDDEVGNLAIELNNLVNDLQAYAIELEEMVGIRTEELRTAVTILENEINDRKRIENQLRKLSQAVEQSPSVVVITDTNGIIEYVNPRFTELTGFLSEEAIGQPTSIQKSGKTPDSVYQSMWETISRGEVWNGEFVNRKKNGEIYYEYAIIAPILTGEDEITHYVAVKEDITARKNAEVELQRLAITDPLSGLYNRRHFFALARQEFEHALRYKHDLSVLMIDVDHFKKINDNNGHGTGDLVLETLGRILQELLRQADIIARYGGEEFVILLPDTGLESASLAANRICQYIAASPIYTEGDEILITVSIGVAGYHSGIHSVEQLVDMADMALYQAKNNGRNMACVYNPNASS